MRRPLPKEFKILSLIFLGMLWIINLTNFIITFEIISLIILIVLSAMITVIFIDKKY